MAQSNAKVTRRNDVVPGDGQDNPPDGSTSKISWSDPDKVNWGDALQSALLKIGEDLGRVGPLKDRPTAGPNSPVWWLVTDEPSSPYLTYNDGSVWAPLNQFGSGAEVGANPQDTITASGPVGYTAGGDRDVHTQTDLTIANTTGSDATEDVTVTLYDGTGTGGTQLLTETQSVTVTANSSTTVTFIATEVSLNGDYYLDIGYSGSTLATASDGVAERTEGATYQLLDVLDGEGQLRDTRRMDPVMTIDPLTGEVSFPNGTTSGASGSEDIHYEPGHTQIPDGQDDVEYHRLVPPSGGTVTITSMQFNQQGGGSSSSCTLDVYDVGAGSVVNQITLGSADRSTYTAGQGNTVLVRISNSTGSDVDAAPTIDGYIDT